MDIEKPFKCGVCESHFTNEDHLQVHKRRHEMSLNLGKNGNGYHTSNILDTFVDETPTPTRFFRNCEEVGLFQDLQNVNPFDEQFSKAATATPSTANEPFDFSLAAVVASSSSASAAASDSNSTPNSSGGGNKRRYSDQDTLNTPQVFGYVLNPVTTASSTGTSTITTTTSLATTTPVSKPSSTLTVTSSISSSEIGVKKRRSTIDEDTNTKEDPGDGSNVYVSFSNAAAAGSSAKLICEKIPRKLSKTKTNLKLNLSPIINSNSLMRESPTYSIEALVISPPGILSQTTENSQKRDDKVRPPHIILPAPKLNPITENKPAENEPSELLERNRLAAVRSRQRRKQWLMSLESKCQILESLLEETRKALKNQQSENERLTKELALHEDCDVARKRKQTEGYVTVGPKLSLVGSSININQGAVEGGVLSTDPSKSTSASTDNSDGQIITCPPPELPPPLIIPQKPKRGRPRRGQERRVNFLTLPIIPPPTVETYKPILKVPIQPLGHKSSVSVTNATSPIMLISNTKTTSKI